MHYEGDERRRYPRSHKSFPGIRDESGPGVLNHVDNISGSGVSCHTVKPVPLMTKLSVVIELPKPHERRVEAEGIVVRCDPHEMGDDHFRMAILFTKVSDEDHKAIVDYVEHDLSHVHLRD